MCTTAERWGTCIKVQEKPIFGMLGPGKLLSVTNFGHNRSMGEIRIGISGWRYPPWRGTFYPPGLPQKKELEFAAQHFNSIEINGSFYSLQDVPNWQRWYEQTPPRFV